MKHLIDECLSPQLVDLAVARGYLESAHVTRRGLTSYKDWQLRPEILAGDWTFVTKNSVDFRGPKDKPGTRGQYAAVELHAGLICLNGPVGMDIDVQKELYDAALDELDRDADLVNQVLEINLTDDESEIEVARYSLPSDA